MYFTFRQNNSGGFWRGPRVVVVEADTSTEANERADIEAASPVYFEDRGDCVSCCGPRWRHVYDDDGDVIPSAYGRPVEEPYLLVFRNGLTANVTPKS